MRQLQQLRTAFVLAHHSETLSTTRAKAYLEYVRTYVQHATPTALVLPNTSRVNVETLSLVHIALAANFSSAAAARVEAGIARGRGEGEGRGRIVTVAWRVADRFLLPPWSALRVAPSSSTPRSSDTRLPARISSATASTSCSCSCSRLRARRRGAGERRHGATTG